MKRRFTRTKSKKSRRRRGKTVKAYHVERGGIRL